MAPIKLKCQVPGCSEETIDLEPELAIRMMELHNTQVHSMSRKPDKPKRPELALTADTVEDTDFEQFQFMFQEYKKLAGLGKNSPSHLLECLSKEIYNILYSMYGPLMKDQTEENLLTNIKRLVVKQRNTMAQVMTVLKMTQESDQPVLSFIAQLKAAARLCEFKSKCAECQAEVDFTDSLVLYKLVAGVAYMELQEELLKKADFTLAHAEKTAVGQVQPSINDRRIKFCDKIQIQTTEKW